MKYLYSIPVVLFILGSALMLPALAQSPLKMSYQTVIRDTENELVVNQNVRIRISILQGSPIGTIAYSEVHTPTTNVNGLATLEIGGGAIIGGNMATIDWGNGPYYLKTET